MADAGRVTFSNSNNYHHEAGARMSRASCSNLIIISDYYCNVCVKTTNVTAACSTAAETLVKYASCLVQSAVTKIEVCVMFMM